MQAKSQINHVMKTTCKPWNPQILWSTEIYQTNKVKIIFRDNENPKLSQSEDNHVPDSQ